MERDAGHWPPTAVPSALRQQWGNQIPCSASFKVRWVNFQPSAVPLVRMRGSPPRPPVRSSSLKAVGPHSSGLQSPWLPSCAQNKGCRGLPVMGCRLSTGPAHLLHKGGDTEALPWKDLSFQGPTVSHWQSQDRKPRSPAPLAQHDLFMHWESDLPSKGPHPSY